MAEIEDQRDNLAGDLCLSINTRNSGTRVAKDGQFSYRVADVGDDVFRIR